eukprot:TRINITY_DN95714_c0_g1_i1.p1 TRINITY_DN95714_c0_g1~~TRINITY_DN95714_c0_g1_i1.p1  ORF type:complete len:100 (-),score=14.10 TRINITY_DN95714_c0_g1_i1:110-409(-)
MASSSKVVLHGVFIGLLLMLSIPLAAMANSPQQQQQNQCTPCSWGERALVGAGTFVGVTMVGLRIGMDPFSAGGSLGLAGEAAAITAGGAVAVAMQCCS